MTHPITPHLLSKIAACFGLPDRTSPILLGNSSNLIFETQYREKPAILRVSAKSAAEMPHYQAEIDWVNTLAENGAPVCRALPSRNGNVVEGFGQPGASWLVSVFEKAPGCPPDTGSPQEWNAALFTEWGRTMGKIHQLSSRYAAQPAPRQRGQWQEDIYFQPTYNFAQEEEGAARAWAEVIHRLQALPKAPGMYGLIHNDFHQGNFFVHNRQITVFDFDDCLYHWYTCDIAIALYHAVESVPKAEPALRRIHLVNFAREFLHAFLDGYQKAYTVPQGWAAQLPLFLEYRRLCSYRYLSAYWPVSQREDWQQSLLERMRKKIEDRVLDLEIDFSRIA